MNRICGIEVEPAEMVADVSVDSLYNDAVLYKELLRKNNVKAIKAIYSEHKISEIKQFVRIYIFQIFFIFVFGVFIKFATRSKCSCNVSFSFEHNFDKLLIMIEEKWKKRI